MSHRALRSDERGFLALVARAAFTNPFGDERARTDLELAGGSGAQAREALIDRLLRRVQEGLASIAPSGRLALDRYVPADRELLTSAVLFEVFHRFSSAMDTHIQAQFEAGAGGAAPVRVSFADALLSDLGAWGLPSERCAHFLALFYQMRRAFFFIDRGLIGRSSAMRRLRESLWSNVFTDDIRLYERHLIGRMQDFSTILLGGTGSGKGAAAAAIGRSGWIPYDARRGHFEASFNETFLPINLSQFADSLIESELFGHRKGAFTGAVDAHIGVFQRCHRLGTIFLDEIGDVSVPIQIKLLRVIQERTFSPVGSHEEASFPGRVIAATNRSLATLRADGAFRDDFYYRLCSDVIELPPLAQRIAEEPGELDCLVSHLVGRIVGSPDTELANQVLRAIRTHLPADYGWPGNVRELEQAARRILMTGRYAGDLAAASGAPSDRAALAAAMDAGTIDARELLARYCRLLYEREGSYEKVAALVDLDRRTVAKYVKEADPGRNV